MNDREKFTELLHAIYAGEDRKLDEMGRVVAKNQNTPPLGKGDGSFTDKQWESARDILVALRVVAARRWDFK